MLRISWYLPQTGLLGPGSRFALWVQGCMQHCDDCIASALQDPQGGTLLAVDALVSLILETPGIEGITISGGEPFLQAKQLGNVLHRVREERPSLGVIVYTGYLYEDLREDDTAQALLNETDLLIDGSYQPALDDGRGMRGSSNQRLLHLTQRYRDITPMQDRKTELRIEGGIMRMIGIPSQAAREMFSLLQDDEPTKERGIS
jgi:anaerobic ribonucleoside-triphosphate reductase activating protein